MGAWRWLVLLACLPLLALSIERASAQQAARVERLTVSLLPQYDDPRLLILYEVTLDAPGSVALAVPPAVELHAAAYLAEDGRLRDLEAAFEGASDGRFIRFTSPTRNARLELYQDVIPQQAERTVDFTLPAQRDALDALHWVVVFPLDATDLATEPAMSEAGQNHFGMAEFTRDAGPLPARQPATQRLTWVRESDAPSFLSAAASSVPEAPVPTDSPSTLQIALVLGFGLGLGLVVNGLWRLRRERAS